MARGRSLTRKEFEAVIRRASELAASEPDSDMGELDEAELYRIAEEVGLPARHVRRALGELRQVPLERSLLDRLLGPAVLRAGRTVPGERRELAGVLDDFFVDTQLLDPVRRTPSLLQYRPAVDWVSRIARAASATSGRYYVASANQVEVSLEEVEGGRSAVLLEVDPGTRRDYLVRGGIGAAAAALAAGAGVAALTASAPLWVTAVVAFVVAAAGASGAVAIAGSAHRRKLRAVRSEMEGILDRLEAGESLEPPPPSWRRWVRRQFHGVAREMLSSERSGNDEPGGEA